LEKIKAHNIKFKYVTDLDRLTGSDKHQGVAAVINAKTTRLDFKQLLKNLDARDDGIILILDGITDVHNFGAIIRSADCFGVYAIIVPKNNSANIDNPLVAKASSGAVNTTTVITVNNLSQAIDQLKQHDFWIAGTALSPNATNLFDFKCNKKIAWVLGNEGSGMRRLVSENCDYLVTIPMQGVTGSLNVSVAAGVVLAYTRFSALHRA
jgi:23S rRNA (guanosine2251-2'-O)-methyltransferase